MKKKKIKNIEKITNLVTNLGNFTSLIVKKHAPLRIEDYTGNCTFDGKVKKKKKTVHFISLISIEGQWRGGRE